MNTRPMRRWERALVHLALRVAPRSFRSRFGEALTETGADGLGDRRRIGRHAFLLRSVVGLIRAGLREQFAPTLPDDSSPPAGAMDAFAQELRFALRALRRRPGFALLVVGTLALGIGSTTAVFSVVDGVLLRPLPYSAPDRLTMVWAYDTQSEPARGSMSPPDVESLREVEALAAVEAFSRSTYTLTGDDAPTRIAGARTTGSLLSVMGGSPFLGRDLNHADDVGDGPRVVVVGHGFWQDRLGADRNVVGRTLELDEEAYEIVGVMPP
ncbi:MAG: ABC transporter permease, partial [Longimicrobiales bacterium]